MTRRLLLPALALAVLASPEGAAARVVELGAGADTANASCPTSCQAIGRVTGYQGRSAAVRNPFVVGRDGYVVAFTVTLGKPDANQVRFFTDLYGGPPQVRLSILRRGKRRQSRLDHRLMGQSRLYRVDQFFGSSPTFALGRPLRVRKGNIVAVTVPTWAPAFAVGLRRSSWWRSSRRRGDCDNVSQSAAMETAGRVGVFGCTYYTARLLYTATYIPDPRPTDGSERRRR